MADKMRKYQEAFRALQQSYELYIDRLGYDEHKAFMAHLDRLNGIKEVAIYDTEISRDEFCTVNEFEIRRREDA